MLWPDFGDVWDNRIRLTPQFYLLECLCNDRKLCGHVFVCHVLLGFLDPVLRLCCILCFRFYSILLSLIWKSVIMKLSKVPIRCVSWLFYSVLMRGIFLQCLILGWDFRYVPRYNKVLFSFVVCLTNSNIEWYMVAMTIYVHYLYIYGWYVNVTLKFGVCKIFGDKLTCYNSTCVVLLSLTVQ
jgi:hypothetical protein